MESALSTSAPSTGPARSASSLLSRLAALDGVTVVRLALGLFFLFQGIGKASWLMDSAPLTGALGSWLQQAIVINRWYLEWVALPGAPLFARLVALAELATGVALLTGYFARPAAIAAFAMVLHFHFASGALFQYRFLTNAFGLPVLGGLLGIAVGYGRAVASRASRG